MKCHAEILLFRFYFWFWNLSESVLILMPKIHQFVVSKEERLLQTFINFRHTAADDNKNQTNNYGLLDTG